MPGILAILQNIPLWVFAVFALLVWFGVQGLRTRTVSLWRLLVTPAVFIAWGVVALVLRSSPMLIADWAAAGATGAAIAWTTVRLDSVEIDRAHGVLRLPGSWLPMIRNMTIFSAKFALALAIARAPAWRETLAAWDIAVSGASTGYFIGWLARLALAYRQRPEMLPGSSSIS
jgi:hypothetical protein